ncbi:MAG: TIGR02757 family protein [Syntrophorhabdales bacterium]|jgi:uncharacterized protein (TIGR02757 family)
MGNDPVAFPHRFTDPGDIEIAGFIASQFAYGRVGQVTRFLGALFKRMGESPYKFVASGDFSALNHLYYRFQKGPDIVRLFVVLRDILERFGGIGGMVEHYYEGDFRQAVWAAREALVADKDDLLFFFPRPAPSSAFKRWSLYARWMVRRDEIDFGLWQFVRTRDLIVPLDANIWKIGRCLGWTDQRSQVWKAACQITDELKRHCPEDPLKYDFFLCHVVGIGAHCAGLRNAACQGGCLLHEV